MSLLIVKRFQIYITKMKNRMYLLFIDTYVNNQRKKIMLKFNKAVRVAVLDVIAIHELRNTLKSDVYENIYGEYAGEVMAFNMAMGVTSWIQLGLDIKNKKGMKKIIINQTAATVIVLGHNLYYNTDVRDSVKAYIKK